MRALTKDECFDLLGKNYVGRIGYLSDGKPEVLPITYYFDREKEVILSYSAEGNKINCMRKNPMVSFQVDEVADLQHWKSVIFHGEYEELKRSDAKVTLHNFSRGVKDVVQQKDHKDLIYLSEFSSKIENSQDSIIYQIKILEIKGKERSE